MLFDQAKYIYIHIATLLHMDSYTGPTKKLHVGMWKVVAGFLEYYVLYVSAFLSLSDIIYLVLIALITTGLELRMMEPLHWLI